jgi:membrane protein implicated in regulation of membrane protease activity
MSELHASTTLRTLPSWALAVIGVLGAAVGLAIFILGTGLLLILVPSLLIALFILRWRLRSLLRKAQEQSQADGPQVIEGEFKVVKERRGKLRIFR